MVSERLRMSATTVLAGRRAIGDHAIPLLLFIGFFSLYSATRTHFNTFDAVSYANQIERLYPRSHDPRWLFHPHHLLFNISGAAAYAAARICGWRGSALECLEAINAAFAAFGIALFFRLLSRKTGSVLIALAAALTGGLTYGYWVAATDGRVNTISAVLLLAAFSVLSPAGGRRSIAAAGIVGALAVLYHESAALFVPVGTILAFFADVPGSKPPVKERIRNAAIFCGVCLGAVLAAYLVVGIAVLGMRSPHAFRHWATQYAELGWWWDFHIGRNISLDREALLQAIVVPSRPSAAPSAAGWLSPAAVFGCIAALLSLAASTFLLWRQDRASVAGCWVWILVYAAFFTVWSPGYFIFWIPVVLAAGILAFWGPAAASPKPAVRGAAAAVILAWCACVGSQNATAGIRPHLRAGSSPFQRVAADIKTHTRPGDLVVLTGEGDLAECEVNIPYFGDRDAISLHTMLARRDEDPGATKAAVRAEIETAMRGGHNIYMLDEAHNPAGASALLIARHPAATVSFLRDLFAPWTSAVAWRSDHGPVWKLKERQATKKGAPSQRSHPSSEN